MDSDGHYQINLFYFNRYGKEAVKSVPPPPPFDIKNLLSDQSIREIGNRTGTR